MSRLPIASKEELVSQYTAAEFTLFPLRSTGPTLEVAKEPAVPKGTNWKDWPFNEHLTKADLPQAYGVVLPPEIFIVDVDPRRYENENDDQLVRLWEELGLDCNEPPNTFIVNTASGGMHIYYTKPADLKIKTSKGMKDAGFGAIELKTYGHYVVGAGSRVHDKERGEWLKYSTVRGTPLHIGAAPKVLLDFIQRDAIAVRDVGIESDSLATRQRFVKYCMSCPPAIAYAGGNDHTLSVAHVGREFGLPEERSYEIMLEYFNHRCEPEWDHGKLREIVKNAYAYGQNAQGSRHPAADFVDAPKYVKDAIAKAAIVEDYRFDTSRKQDGTIKTDATIGNVYGYFVVSELALLPGQPNPLNNLIRFNSFANDIEFTRPAPWHHPGENPKFWADSDTLHLKLFLNQVCHFVIGTDVLNEGISIVAQKHRVHPVREYLHATEWDGIPRLDNWQSVYCGVEETPYTREVGKNTLMAAVARVEEPGCKHDSILVWEGEQGTGKSSAIEILGGAWYLDPHLDLKNMKDSTAVLENGWIVELSEMDFARKADFVTLRAFVTRKIDKIRPAYARRHVYMPRQCVFIGSFNPEPYTGYLVDPTGNRRFWPVKTGTFDLEGLAKVRDQLFAEARHRYELGEPYHLVDKDLIEAAKKEQMSRMAEDSFKETIELYLGKKNKLEAFSGFTTDLIAVEALNCVGAALTNGIRGRICRVLTDLGYRRTREYEPGSNVRKTVWVDTSAANNV